jgi:hypothetical protein
MFCWLCIIVYQYNETNVMHFSFNLLRIKGLYMFRALLAHPQELIYKRHLGYCVRVMSVGCFTATVPQPTDITRTQYTKCRLCNASWGWASNARNMQRPLILNKLNEMCITFVSFYWYTMMHGQQNIKSWWNSEFLQAAQWRRGKAVHTYMHIRLC